MYKLIHKALFRFFLWFEWLKDQTLHGERLDKNSMVHLSLKLTIHIKAIMDFPLLSVYHISFCAYPRSAKLKSLRYMAKGAPYSNRKHCPWSAWNVSSIVQPLLKWLHITWSCFDANLMAGCRGDAAFLTVKANSLWMHFQKFAERNPWLNLFFDKFTQQYSDNLLMCVWLADQSEQTGP